MANRNNKGRIYSEYIYIIVEPMIFVGPTLVAKPELNHIYLAEDISGNINGKNQENLNVFEFSLSNISSEFV